MGASLSKAAPQLQVSVPNPLYLVHANIHLPDHYPTAQPRSFRRATDQNHRRLRQIVHQEEAYRPAEPTR